MKHVQKLLTGSLILGALNLGIVAQAKAATLVKSWTVTSAQSIHPKSSGRHSFWLPKLKAGRFNFEEPGLFEQYDNGEAHLTGTITSARNKQKQWSVDLWFIPATQTNLKPKTELHKAHYVSKGGTIDPASWSYYNLDDTRATLTGLEAYWGETLYLTQAPADQRYAFQLGEGANGKNLSEGLSGWFYHTGSYKGKGDVNVDVTPVPEPSFGLISVGLLGLGMTAARRKQTA
ncbi:MAG: hypothetical protein AAF152_00745 [Cyanobacteria bacterium P01_A01_bin.114]